MSAHQDDRRRRCPVCLHLFASSQEAEAHLRLAAARKTKKGKLHRAYTETEEEAQRRELQTRYQGARKNFLRRAAGAPA